jgi:hypothetical protein
MTNLSNDVYQYYRDHFTELAADKQLHFASRLALWSNDAFGQAKLAELRGYVTHNNNITAALQNVYDEAQKTVHHGSKNAAGLRTPYFIKYPHLRTVAMLLFRITFLKTVYGIDCTKEIFSYFSKTELDNLAFTLLNDTEALAILSTHAINFLYLYNRVILGDENSLNAKVFMKIQGTGVYDLTNPVHIQLFIYLYTHCIIGESQFYARQLPEQSVPIYKHMLDELETLIEANFELVNLDNKFEFLVCCELVGHRTNLRERIEAEAEISIAETGTYLVDRHNRNQQTTNVTIDLSEHRNVLYIMANRPALLSFRAAV